jgi:hypothetical protein
MEEHEAKLAGFDTREATIAAKRAVIEHQVTAFENEVADSTAERDAQDVQRQYGRCQRP